MPDGISRQKSRDGARTITTISTQLAAPVARWTGAGAVRCPLGRFALAIASPITAYTLVDGSGARLSGSALQYSAWLFLLEWSRHRALRLGARGVADLSAPRSSTRQLAVAGAIRFGVAMWTMTIAPIALIAALGETSVLLAALYGMALLREPVLPTRIVAARVELAGMALMPLD
ncbi:MAG TPA: hypothetical protein VLL28_07470 [Hyphomicrobiaceae bacterium]|nr:hypothetical protein [Hyphomicrobiaceae bacterium]